MKEEGISQQTKQSMKEHFYKKILNKHFRHNSEEIEKDKLHRIKTRYKNTAVGVDYKKEYISKVEKKGFKSNSSQILPIPSNFEYIEIDHFQISVLPFA